jgi:hypothetical protein
MVTYLALMKKHILFCAFLSLSVTAASAQNIMKVIEKDNSHSVYKIPEVDKVIFNNGDYTVELTTGHTNKFPVSKIKTVTFNNNPTGCTDPLAYNYNSTATISDSCKYVLLEKKDSTAVVDTVGTNPFDVCDSLDLKTTIDHAKIISQLIFGEKIEITWEVKQNNNNIHIKALYNLPQKNGAVLFVLTIKCQKSNTNSRRTVEKTVYRSFGHVLVMGPTVVNTVAGTNSSLTCYPNPTNGTVTIEALFNQVHDRANIYIFNTNGTQVKHVTLQQTSYKVIEVVDISNLAPGIYLCKIVSGENIFYQKIIKL